MPLRAYDTVEINEFWLISARMLQKSLTRRLYCATPQPPCRLSQNDSRSSVWDVVKVAYSLTREAFHLFIRDFEIGVDVLHVIAIFKRLYKFQ